VSRLPCNAKREWSCIIISEGSSFGNTYILSPWYAILQGIAGIVPPPPKTIVIAVSCSRLDKMSGHSRVQTVRISMLLVFALRVAQSLPLPLLERDQVICATADWQTVITFLLLNYATHALTVKSFPGDTMYDVATWSLAALLTPYSGIIRGCVSIIRGKIWGDNELNNAVRAGALCAVVRSDSWRPYKNEIVTGCKISGIGSTTTENIITASLRLKPLNDDVFGRRGPVSERSVIHGQYILPPGYHFEILPNDVSVVPLYTSPRSGFDYRPY